MDFAASLFEKLYAINIWSFSLSFYCERGGVGWDGREPFPLSSGEAGIRTEGFKASTIIYFFEAVKTRQKN